MSNANQLAIVKSHTQKLEARAKENETALNLAALAQHVDIFEHDPRKAHESFQRSSEAARREAEDSGNGSGESLSLALLLHADFLQRTIHRRKLDVARGKSKIVASENGGKDESKGGAGTTTSSSDPCPGMQLSALLEKAERLFQRALDCDHPHPMARGSYAIFLHMYKRDYDAAEVAYGRALKEHPEHASVRCKVGRRGWELQWSSLSLRS